MAQLRHAKPVRRLQGSTAETSQALTDEGKLLRGKLPGTLESLMNRFQPSRDAAERLYRNRFFRFVFTPLVVVIGLTVGGLWLVDERVPGWFKLLYVLVLVYGAANALTVVASARSLPMILRDRYRGSTGTKSE